MSKMRILFKSGQFDTGAIDNSEWDIAADAWSIHEGVLSVWELDQNLRKNQQWFPIRNLVCWAWIDVA